MSIPFTKMHGLGNDYVYVDGVAAGAPVIADPAGLARRIADRHRGVGGDGLVLILPSAAADVTMRMWNADGSEAEQCGNALRCVARYAVDHGLAGGPELTIETRAGVRQARVLEDGQVGTGLGEPILERARIPMLGEPTPRVVDEPFEIDGTTLSITAVSMGNPHLILEVDDTTSAPVQTLGPRLETDPRFPNRINVEFITIESPTHLRMRVWERGTGETEACGSGAAAAVVAATLRNRITPPVTVHLPGGTLHITWHPGEQVWIEGPATYVFEGTWPE